MGSNPPLRSRQRRVHTFQETTTRHIPDAVPTPPTVSTTRVTYSRSRGGALRIIAISVDPSRPLTGTERFLHERAARPVPTRVQSLPPPTKNKSLRTYRVTKHKKTSLWDQLEHYKQSTSRLLQRSRNAVRDGSNRIQAALRNAAVKLSAIALVSAVAVGVAYATTNSVAYNMQPRPDYVTQWAREPTWLYADSPDQILGLHAPLWPRALQPPDVVAKHYKRMNRYWATDKIRLHDVAKPSEADMKMIFKRYAQAQEHYHRRPPYQDIDFTTDIFNMTIPGDNLPRYQAGCVCNMTLAISNQVLHALTPYWQHEPVPHTAADLESYCPCSIGAAASRLVQGYSPKFLPPRLDVFDREDPELASRWDPGSLYLIRRSRKRTTKEDRKRAQQEGWTWRYMSVARRAMMDDMSPEERQRAIREYQSDKLGDYSAKIT